MRAVGPERVVTALNEDFAAEMAGIMQYLWHHFTGPEEYGAGVRELFRQTAVEEMRHLAWLGRRIVELGGEPPARLPPFARGGDLRRMMEDDLARERDAVERYRQHIALCASEGDEETEALLRRILEDELRHVETWAGQLGLAVPAR